MTRLVTLIALTLVFHTNLAAAAPTKVEKPGSSLTAQIDGFHGVPGTGKTVTSRAGN